MSSNWKKDLDDSLRIVKNAFLTGDMNTEFKFSSENDDSDAEVKNALKKKKLYIVALVVWLGFTQMISFVGNMLLIMFDIPYDNMTLMMLRYFITFLGSVGIIIVVWRWRKQGKEAKSVYDERIMAKAVQEIMPGAVLEPDSSIDSSELYHLGVIPDYDKSQGSYLIRYQKTGKTYLFSNLTLVRREKDHRDNYYNKVVFRGQAYVLRYKSEMQGYVRIMTTTQWLGREVLDGFRRQDKHREEKIETENQIFNRQFDVYTTNPHTAFYVVTPLVMERLLAMKEKYGSFGVAVNGDEIVIALCSGYYLFEPPHRYQDIENISVEKSKNEIQQMLLFAQLLEDTVNGRV